MLSKRQSCSPHRRHSAASRHHRPPRHRGPNQREVFDAEARHLAVMQATGKAAEDQQRLDHQQLIQQQRQQIGDLLYSDAYNLCQQTTLQTIRNQQTRSNHINTTNAARA